jgi:hypothetical protein
MIKRKPFNYTELKKQLHSLHYHSPNVPIIKKSFQIPTREKEQLLLPGSIHTDYYVGRGINVFSGAYFEKITAAIYGGVWHNQNSLELENNNHRFQPDISDFKSAIHYEVKGSAATQQLKMTREQIEKMALWQLIPHNQKYPKMISVFYRHNLRHLITGKKTTEDFIEEMRKEILYSIKTPLSIPLQFFLNPEKTRDFLGNLYHYPNGNGNNNGHKGCSYLHIQAISSNFLNELALKPEETLNLIGLNPDEYNINRRKVAGLKINNKNIFVFPMIDINLKDYNGWIKREEDTIREKLLYRVGEENIGDLPLFNPQRSIVFGNESCLSEGSSLEEMVDKGSVLPEKLNPEETTGFPWESESRGRDGEQNSGLEVTDEELDEILKV